MESTVLFSWQYYNDATKFTCIQAGNCANTNTHNLPVSLGFSGIAAHPWVNDMSGCWKVNRFNTLNSISLTLKLGIEIESSSPGFVLRQDFSSRIWILSFGGTTVLPSCRMMYWSQGDSEWMKLTKLVERSAKGLNQPWWVHWTNQSKPQWCVTARSDCWWRQGELEVGNLRDNLAGKTWGWLSNTCVEGFLL